ncbi:MAG: SUMF1/EgtB/PvdO family nonheme iron enzyme, partial [Anaerolineales bacterium]|nr:SUMF1/EgtB/PvdO family nonheme iron enzyme [Anaerolineales bacterium]
RYWQDAKWNRADYPVVGVSWYEAVAFCRWTREVSGEIITLPTEQQWQRAAQGDDGRAYPWGTGWDVDRCNNSVGRGWHKKQTSQVTRYEWQDKGDSPFGVVDMSGNVWEWCLTEYKTGNQEEDKAGVRVVRRGGAWNENDPKWIRADCRNNGDPDLRLNINGFRLARTYSTES